MTQDGYDPLQEADPWCVQNSKGRTRPAGSEARTLAHFMPPGLSSIVPKEPPSNATQEQPPLVEQPGAKALSRAELEKGMDLIQGLLDEQTADCEKRAQALELAKAASVPWLPPPRNDFPEKRTASRHLNRFSRVAEWCNCDDGNCSGEKQVFRGVRVRCKTKQFQ